VNTSTPGLRAFNRQMGFLFSSLGVDSSKTVIFYQNNTGYDAARGVWLLWYLGHRNAKILDGGLNTWRRKKLPTDTRDAAMSLANFKPRPNPKLLATFAEVMSHLKLKGKEIQILDVRSKGEFLGQNRRAVKGGHIPSAKNIDWTSTLTKDGSLKTASNLEKLYLSREVEATKDTITYCQSGYRAAHSWLVLKLLGFNVKNYLGSWYEWGNRSDTPIAS
jgi:thiosulfate/3-mercaptopyruvate sulfurtransferase